LFCLIMPVVLIMPLAMLVVPLVVLAVPLAMLALPKGITQIVHLKLDTKDIYKLYFQNSSQFLPTHTSLEFMLQFHRVSFSSYSMLLLLLLCLLFGLHYLISTNYKLQKHKTNIIYNI
jgi:hypothetical protein